MSSNLDTMAPPFSGSSYSVRRPIIGFGTPMTYRSNLTSYSRYGDRPNDPLRNEIYKVIEEDDGRPVRDLDMN